MAILQRKCGFRALSPLLWRAARNGWHHWKELVKMHKNGERHENLRRTGLAPSTYSWNDCLRAQDASGQFSSHTGPRLSWKLIIYTANCMWEIHFHSPINFPREFFWKLHVFENYKVFKQASKQIRSVGQSDFGRLSSSMTSEVEDELYNLDGPLPWYATVPYEFEAAIDRRWRHLWLKRNWTLSFYLVAGYLLVIYGLVKWMRHRKPFELKGPLFLWNICLSIFSTVATVRVGLEFLRILTDEDGYHQSICDGRSDN